MSNTPCQSTSDTPATRPSASYEGKRERMLAWMRAVEERESDRPCRCTGTGTLTLQSEGLTSTVDCCCIFVERRRRMADAVLEAMGMGPEGTAAEKLERAY